MISQPSANRTSKDVIQIAERIRRPDRSADRVQVRLRSSISAAPDQDAPRPPLGLLLLHSFSSPTAVSAIGVSTAVVLRSDSRVRYVDERVGIKGRCWLSIALYEN